MQQFTLKNDLLYSCVSIVKSWLNMSGFKTQLPKRGTYQSLNTDNHNTIISNCWLGTSSWFHMVGWTHQYNTRFRGIMRAVSFRAVLNHLTSKGNLNGANEMLVLTRKRKEKIYIGESITIINLGCDGDTVKLGIDAPQEVTILRAELAKNDIDGGEL